MPIVWSELGSGFGEPGGTPPPRIPIIITTRVQMTNCPL